jgi:lipid A disaccharide synthetase
VLQEASEQSKNAERKIYLRVSITTYVMYYCSPDSWINLSRPYRTQILSHIVEHCVSLRPKEDICYYNTTGYQYKPVGSDLMTLFCNFHFHQFTADACHVSQRPLRKINDDKITKQPYANKLRPQKE